MNAIEIILLILGFFSISISFFVGSREKDLTEESAESENFSRDIWTEKEEEVIREQIRSILEDEKEGILAETMDALNRRSNEKIMEFDEFSGQLLAKINHNHDEVVFMYNMLTEKEKEWKEAMAQARSQAKQPEQRQQPVAKPAETKMPEGTPGASAAGTKPSRKPAEPRVAPVRPDAESPAGDASVLLRKGPVTGLERARNASSSIAREKVPVPEIKEQSQPRSQAPSPQPQAQQPQPQRPQKQSQPQKPLLVEDMEEQLIGDGLEMQERTENVNDQIIQMHKQGKSVVEISKELNVGQGEVKLTLALYGGNR